MRDAHDGIRKRDLDNGAEGLDCFATEGVEVVAEVDDSALAEFDEVLPAVHVSSLPALPERGWVELPAPRPSWPGAHKAAVALILVLVGVAGFWMTIWRERPVTTAAVAPVRSTAPAAPSVTPSSERGRRAESARPVPAPPAAAAVTVPRNTPAVASPRASSATVAEPTRRASVAPATVSSNPAIAPEVAPPAPLAATPAVSVPAPVVVATPDLVKAEPAAAAPLPAAIVAPPSDRASIERVLQQYRDAYDRLDAPSAAVIWPRVDTRALSRAFSTLASQDLLFDHCDLDIAGVKARAQCTGAIRYVRRVGDQEPRMRRMSWSFAFERVSDRWQIAQVTAD